MDDRARKYFNKAESELSEYERMMLDIMAANEPAQETPAPAEDAPAEEAPLEEAPAEEAPAEEAPAEEIPADEEPASEEPAEEASVEEAPAAEELALEDIPPEEAPAAAVPDAGEPDDSDVKIAGEEPAEKKRQPIPLLTEEKNPELEPVVVNRPTIQFMNSIEREKKITRKVKRHRLRSGVVVLGLCVALLLVAVLWNGFENDTSPTLPSQKTTPAPEPTAEPVPTQIAATPAPTPTPTPEPTPEHRYDIQKANVSWVGAQDRCLRSGGYLVVINTRDEFNKITAMADELGVDLVWIGARRDIATNRFVWERDEKIDAGVDPNDFKMPLWGLEAPSFNDGSGNPENYLILIRENGGWYYEDSIDNVNQYYGWLGRIAYVCEFDD